MAIHPIQQPSIESFLHLSRGNQLNIRRNTRIAVIFSLAFHALILGFIVPKNQPDKPTPLPMAMEVSLAPPPEVLPEIPQEIPQEKPVQKTVKPQPKIMTQKQNTNIKPTFTVPEVLATPSPTPEIEPKTVENPEAKSMPAEAPTDMASYIKAQQSKRRLAEADAAKQNAEAVAREVAPSAAQVRDERIKNNFKNGTNGIFEITSLNIHSGHAAFSFKGWVNDYSNSTRESFEVEAASHQDVRLLMVKKMIALIRKHYQGDFNWESQRLGRTITQSARPEDNAGLEDFMMMEFFGTHYKNALP